MGERDSDPLSLRLGTSGTIPRRPTTPSTSTSTRVEEKEGKSAQQQVQQITIFYGGRVCVCNVTETQARAIISMAQLEMEEMMKNKCEHPTSPPPTSPHDHHGNMQQLLSPGFSTKRSLQTFLQKRKARMDSSAPYLLPS